MHKIYSLPNYCLFYRPYNSIILSIYRQQVINEYYRRLNYNKKLDEYVKNNTPQRIIFEWSSYTSSTSSTTSSSSFEMIESPTKDWVDMKKLL